MRILYVRHGQSVWNKEQKAALASGASADEIRRLGDLPRFVDAPLSAEGVAQALALRSRLVNEPEQGGELGRAVRCSIDGECAPPNVLTSNLRRAIDTALLGLRPLLDAGNTRVQSLPALQETCHYADCMPLPLGAGNRIKPPSFPALSSISHTLALQSAASFPALSLISHTLALQSAALGEAAGTAEVDYLRAQYGRLHLREHATYDDRRRLADGQQLSAVAEGTAESLEQAVAPLTTRVGEILSNLLAMEAGAAIGEAMEAGEAGAASTPTIIVAHSRLLRELLFLFHTSRLSAPVALPMARSRQPTSMLLLWADTNAPECVHLAGEAGRLNNVGVVLFDLTTCEPPACAQPAVTLHNCRLDVGSRIDVRQPALTSSARHGALTSSARHGALTSPIGGGAVMGAQGGATATASVLMAYSVDAGLLLFFSAICAVSAWHYPMFLPRYVRTHRLLGLAQHACAHHGALSPTGTGAPIGSSASPSHCT
jgi:hypothetical protein